MDRTEQLASDDLFDRYAQYGFAQDDVTLPLVIRVNTLRVSVEDCVAALRKIGYAVEETVLPYAFVLRGGPSLPATLPYLNGWVYSQELSSQLPPFILNPGRDTSVVDIAAAPGSKTTQLAMHMENTGVIVACDPIHERLEKLRNNCDRLGVVNVVAYQTDGKYADELLSSADFVLCDVPCSGNYTQQGWETRTLDDVRSRVPLQKELLETSVFCCKVGGRVAYSTCSLELEENEEVVEWALRELPVKLLPISVGVGFGGLTPTTKDCLRIWPTQHQMGGFFIALFERVE